MLLHIILHRERLEIMLSWQQQVYQGGSLVVTKTHETSMKGWHRDVPWIAEACEGRHKHNLHLLSCNRLTLSIQSTQPPVIVRIRKLLEFWSVHQRK